MHSTGYIVRFVLAMTTIVSLLLTLLYSSWKDQSLINEAIFNKRAILSSVADYLDSDLADMADEEVLNLFDTKVQQLALNMNGEPVDDKGIIASGYKGAKPENIDMAKEKKKPEEDRIMPLYVFDSPKGKCYILSVRGSGLWDEIWGNIALKEDLTTIAGANFDHKGETPGLGAEIKDNKAFPAQFKNGRKVIDPSGEVRITVRKGGAKDETYEVDGLSGATVTADGVTEMLQRCIGYYLPYFKKELNFDPAKLKG